MSQPEPLAAAELPPSASLEERLKALDSADAKIIEVIESSRAILESLAKEGKAMPRNKMDENLKKNGRLLEEDVCKVIQEQLAYMEQMCVGAEHQGSVFRLQDMRRTYRRTLDNLHSELDTLAQDRGEDDEAAMPMET